ncbi:endoglin [Rhinophrynus dorsalis]
MEQNGSAGTTDVLIINTAAALLSIVVTGPDFPLILHYTRGAFLHRRPKDWTEEPTDLPAESETLLSWAADKYGDATFFSELSNPQSIILNMGTDIIGPDSCVLQENFRTTGILEYETQSGEVKGCEISSPSLQETKKAYILHVTHPYPQPGSKPIEVKVKALDGPCEVMPKGTLFLKSEREYSWSLQLEVDFKVKATGSYKMTIPDRDVKLPEMFLPDTRADLIQHAMDNGYNSISYIEAANAAAFTQSLPCETEMRDPTSAPPKSAKDTCLDILNLLKPWRCTREYLVVKLDEILLQLCGTEITLGDPQCGVENHGMSLLLVTEVQKCGTRQYGQQFINQLMITNEKFPDILTNHFVCTPPDIQMQVSHSPEFDKNDNELEADKAVYVQVTSKSETPLHLEECILAVGEEKQNISNGQEMVESSTRRTWIFNTDLRAPPGVGTLTCNFCLSKEHQSECPIYHQLQSNLRVTIASEGSAVQNSGLGMPSVLGISFGVFVMGAIVIAALWYIYTRRRTSVKMQPVPAAAGGSENSSTNQSIESTQSTPCSTSSRA